MASFKFGRSSSGAHACTVGLAPDLFVGAFGLDVLDAISSATHVASQLASDPVLSTLLPPGTAVAMKAVSAAADMAKAGATKSDVAKAIGPKTAAALHRIVVHATAHHDDDDDGDGQ